VIEIRAQQDGGKMFRTALAVLAFSVVASASTITFVTPIGSTTSGPVDAQATFTTGTNSLLITLSNLQANPTDVGQLLSDLDFTLSGGVTSGTLSSSSAQEITVNSTTGTFTLGNTVSTGWGLNNNVNVGGLTSALQLTLLGGFISPPDHLIIGPPTGGLYSNANSSIGTHNPQLNGSATFNLTFAPSAGVTENTTITGATFSFGTTVGSDEISGCVGTIGVAGCHPTNPPVPEPVTSGLVGTGLISLFFLRRRVRG
jgi:hypothetical protein